MSPARLLACSLIAACTAVFAAEDAGKKNAAKGSAADSVLPRRNLPNFKALDTNNDGYISKTEAADRTEVLELFERADRNRDGRLDRKEYRELGRLAAGKG
jgi:EF hand domain-containing protein